MFSTFSEARAFNSGISTWNTSAVTSMSQMFAYALNFNQDISSFDTSRVTLMYAMLIQTDFNFDVSSYRIISFTPPYFPF